MAITKEKKEELVNELENIVEQSPSVVFVHSTGLGVNESNELRKLLNEENSKYKVIKKTLLNMVLDKSKTKGDKPELEGEISIAFGSDLIAPARGIYSFQKKNKDNISIIGGIFEGVFKSQNEMMEIAMIPGLKELRGMFVNIINSPIQGLAVALNQIAEKKS